MSALFHDVGNLYGRSGHQKKISEIYDYARKDGNAQEKSVILKTCQAHCGTASDGSQDTLKDLDAQCSLYSTQIRIREIAAILRFSDELAEGPQRTSEFMLKTHKIRKDSEIFHKYAAFTEVSIDKPNERIALTYNIDLESGKNNKITITTESEFKKMLEFVYKRIIKLDQERKYTKYFCSILSPFKMTSAQFNFWLRRNSSRDLLSVSLNPIILSDIVIPGDNTKKIPEIDKDYEVIPLIRKLKKQAEKITK